MVSRKHQIFTDASIKLEKSFETNQSTNGLRYSTEIS